MRVEIKEGAVLVEIDRDQLEFEISMIDESDRRLVDKGTSRSTRSAIRFWGYLKRLDAGGADIAELAARLVEVELSIFDSNYWCLPRLKIYMMHEYARTGRKPDFIKPRWGH